MPEGHVKDASTHSGNDQKSSGEALAFLFGEHQDAPESTCEPRNHAVQEPLERGKHLELILLISFVSIIPAAESGEEVLEEGKGASQEAYCAERDRT